MKRQEGQGWTTGKNRGYGIGAYLSSRTAVVVRTSCSRASRRDCCPRWIRGSKRTTSATLRPPCRGCSLYGRDSRCPLLVGLLGAGLLGTHHRYPGWLANKRGESPTVLLASQGASRIVDHIPGPRPKQLLNRQGGNHPFRAEIRPAGLASLPFGRIRDLCRCDLAQPPPASVPEG